MVKLSKKAISAISISAAAIIAGGTVAAALLIKSNNKKDDEKIINPLNRDKNYHHYSIVNKLKTNEKISELISLQKDGNSFFYVIDENKFIHNIKTLLQETFKNISAFSTNWNNYNIIVNYKVESVNLVKIDVVWFLPNTKTKYFDQFELLLQVN